MTPRVLAPMHTREKERIARVPQKRRNGPRLCSCTKPRPWARTRGRDVSTTFMRCCLAGSTHTPHEKLWPRLAHDNSAPRGQPSPRVACRWQFSGAPWPRGASLVFGRLLAPWLLRLVMARAAADGQRPALCAAKQRKASAAPGKSKARSFIDSFSRLLAAPRVRASRCFALATGTTHARRHRHGRLGQAGVGRTGKGHGQLPEASPRVGPQTSGRQSRAKRCESPHQRQYAPTHASRGKRGPCTPYSRPKQGPSRKCPLRRWRGLARTPQRPKPHGASCSSPHGAKANSPPRQREQACRWRSPSRTISS
jgi:hypothetical protein